MVYWDHAVNQRKPNLFPIAPSKLHGPTHYFKLPNPSRIFWYVHDHHALDMGHPVWSWSPSLSVKSQGKASASWCETADGNWATLILYGHGCLSNSRAHSKEKSFARRIARKSTCGGWNVCDVARATVLSERVGRSFHGNRANRVLLFRIP